MSDATCRPAAVAGQFYPKEPDALRSDVKSRIEENGDALRCLGIVSPHAGFKYSGNVAGAVYSRLAVPETVILLGPNHTGLGAGIALSPHAAWATPLGTVPVDKEFTEVFREVFPWAEESEEAHRREHSLETQLPFLQCVRPDVRIVPIVMKRMRAQDCRVLGLALAKAIRNSGKDVLIVASSDMTHFESQESAAEKDRMAIERIKALDPEGLDDVVRGYNISMCGVNPTTAMLVAAGELGAEEGRLVRYSNSGKVTGDYSHVVAYAGLIVQ